MTQENLEKLRGVKVSFLYGEDNAVWSAQATQRSYDLLREVFPKGDYEMVRVEGYGHLDCWMGKDAWRDVWPRVWRHMERCGADG